MVGGQENKDHFDELTTLQAVVETKERQMGLCTNPVTSVTAEVKLCFCVCYTVNPPNRKNLTNRISIVTQ